MIETLCYLVIGAAVIFYTILDGFDLGVGAIHLFGKTDRHRRVFLNSIGPVWDGNEVWIVIIVGGLFAIFPKVYASLLSGFYSLFMILIAGLVFRAVAIEFRSKGERAWREIWDVLFSLSSVLVAFLIGLMLGNLIEGVPLDENFTYMGTFSNFFRPYPVAVAITGVFLLSMHGSIYLSMKTEDEIQRDVRRWIVPLIFAFILSYLITTVMTFYFMPHMLDRLFIYPVLFIVPFIALTSIVAIPFFIKKAWDGWAFISSCTAITFLLLVYGIGTFPTIVRSSISPNSLTMENAIASRPTLIVVLIVAAIGLPLVFGYGFWVYRIFRGKVRLSEGSY